MATTPISVNAEMIFNNKNNNNNNTKTFFQARWGRAFSQQTYSTLKQKICT
jgi:hypothetical protein